MQGLLKAGERVASSAADRAGERVAKRIADELPRGVGLERTTDGVVLYGRGLRRRWLLDPSLRVLGFLLGNER